MNTKISFLIGIILLLILVTNTYNSIQMKQLSDYFIPEIKDSDIEDSSKVEYQQEWEYKVVQISNKSKMEGFVFPKYSAVFKNWESVINSRAKEGWELLSVIPLISTQIPNFGDSGYVTGLKSFVFAEKIRLIFKRKFKTD